MRNLLCITAFILFLHSCGNSENNAVTKKKPERIWRPGYSKGFVIKIHNDDSTLVLRNPQDTNTIYAEIAISTTKKKGLQLPLQRITSLSATHLAFLAKLKKEKTLVGFAGLQYIRVPEFKSLTDSGSIKELGMEDQINIEELLMLRPDVFMCYPTASNSFHSIQQSGVPVLPLPDYFESHPLARAEYIILFGILTGETNKAEEIFDVLQNQYNKMAATVRQQQYSAISGKPIEGTWYVPAAQSYVAQFLHDAGATYSFSDLKGTNVMPRQVEEVISRAADTDFWFFTHSAPENYNLKSLVTEHPSVVALKCYKNNQIFMCNSESVDIFGQGIIEPHILLKDLIHAMYPDNDKPYTPTYFKRLTNE